MQCLRCLFIPRIMVPEDAHGGIVVQNPSDAFFSPVCSIRQHHQVIMIMMVIIKTIVRTLQNG